MPVLAVPQCSLLESPFARRRLAAASYRLGHGRADGGRGMGRPRHYSLRRCDRQLDLRATSVQCAAPRLSVPQLGSTLLRAPVS